MYTLDEMNSNIRKYPIWKDLFLDLADTDDKRKKLEEVLNDGMYNGHCFDTGLTNNNTLFVEAERRISYAYLLLNNPDTFEYLTKNNLNVFHGTIFNSLDGILKYGMKSNQELSNMGISIDSGESWSIDKNNPRDFISFTDVFDVALNFATFTLNNRDSFEMVICTSSDFIDLDNKIDVSSKFPEFGVHGSIPLSFIKAICVPEDKVKEVSRIVKDYDIKILPLKNIKYKFYYMDEYEGFICNNKIYNSLKDQLRKPKQSEIKRNILDICNQINNLISKDNESCKNSARRR